MASLVEKFNGEGNFLSRGIHIIDNFLSTSRTTPPSARTVKVLKDTIGNEAELPDPTGTVVENIVDINTNLVELQNDVNDLISYSTNERVVGTWIDGKPLYEKTFLVNINSADGSIQTDLTSVIKYGTISAFYNIGNSQYFYGTSGYRNNGGQGTMIYYRKTSGQIGFVARSDDYGQWAITLRYTKVSDYS